MRPLVRSTLFSFVLLSQAFHSEAFAHTLRVSASAARVRAGAGTNTEHVATLANGVPVEIRGSSGNWLKVRVNGEDGFVHRSLFESTSGAVVSSESGASSSASASAYSTSENSSSTLQVTASAARVRATPGGEHINTLRRGTDVTVLGSDGDWYKVQVGGQKAYMHSSVLNGDGTGVVQADVANIRSGPGMGSAITGRLTRGAKIEVLSVEGGWVKMRSGGQEGWIHQGLVRCKHDVQSGNVGQLRQIAEHINTQNAPTSSDLRSWVSPIGSRACQVSPTSRFGMRKHPISGRMKMHNGQDLRAYKGTPLLAPMDGVVTFAGRNGGYGNQVRIRIGNYEVSYSHMNAITRGLRQGSRVAAGAQVGTVGSTGHSTGPHLHLEVSKNGQRIDPMSKFTSSQLCRGHK